MDKKHAVRALGFTADLLELLGQNEFRATAYRRAERTLDRYEGDWETAKLERFKDVPGVGPQLAKQLLDFEESGVFAPLEEAASSVPPGVLDLFRVRGLGPKKIRALWDNGVDSLSGLLDAAQDGSLARLKGFGAATQAKLLAEVQFTLSSQERRHVHDAWAVLAALAAQLEGAANVLPGGSFRRGLETVGDVDAVALGDRAAVLAAIEGLTPTASPEYPALVEFELEGAPVQLAVPTPESHGAVLAVMTGSKAFLNERLFPAAAGRGLTLDSSGLRRDGELVATPGEEDAFAALGLPFVIPEWREPEHLALPDGWLPDPADLLRAEDVRGMLHVHTTWSDAADSVEMMAVTARDLGYQYLGICDHSQSAFYAGGLTPDRLRAQWQEIDAVNGTVGGIRVLKGTECDILADGSLDYVDELLAGCDFVVASVHSSFGLSQADQTERLVRAVSHPLVTILGHPTGRLLLRRPSYRLDLSAVLDAAEEHGTVIEINANAYRLDLDWRDVLAARKRNLGWAVNTDAHNRAGLLDLRWGINSARKAGLTAGQVVNCLDADAFLTLASAKRATAR
ncbi:MAG TPA: helix-hairpin-helix domain-containing protein [Deinococcales bacterium]|nr:helix-hairpin-helix domain-containing protein [Deinococcales bacterium]